MSPNPANQEAAIGALLGTAVGDALGLPAENLSPGRLSRLFPGLVPGPGGHTPPSHTFVFGRGMVSDDTDHACLTAMAVAGSGGDQDRFASHLGWYLRFWFAAIPAGVGMATARACIKLWLGFSPASSGVFSAGNGPCMRAPLLGVLFADRPALLRTLIAITTRITHTDPKAEAAALAVALAAGQAAAFPGQASLSPVLAELRNDSRPAFAELALLLERAAAHADTGKSTSEFAAELGLSRGITGYAFHTVPCVIHAWVRHPADFSRAMTEVISCGGDTDTTAAILGGIVGSGVGQAGIPRHLLDGIADWPWTVERIRSTANMAFQGSSNGLGVAVPRLWWPLIFFRNLYFLALVLAHGFRRLLPPY